MATRAEPGPEPGDRGDATDGLWSRLTEGCRRGDRASFEEVVALTEPRLRRLLGRVGGHRDLDDIVQETYLRAWRSLPGFRGESRLTTWLTRIGINVSRSWGKARRPTAQLSETVERTAVAPPVFRERAVMAAYEVALGRLSPEIRATFLLHEKEAMSYREIAEALACPIGTVMSRLHRAREQIRADLEERLGEWLP